MYKILLLLFSIINLAWNFEPKYENALFPPLPVTVLKTNNSKCIDDSRTYLEHLRNLTLWAYEMYNSNANTPEGIFRGNLNSFGHFDQCLATKAPFTVQYCLTTFIAIIPKPDDDVDLFSIDHDPYGDVATRLYNVDDTQLNRYMVNVAWCLPKSCTTTDIENYLNIYVNDIKLPLNDVNVTYVAKTYPILCTPQDEETNFDVFAIITCVTILVIFLIVLIATLCDSYPIGNDKEAPNLFVISFSAKRNYAELIQDEEAHGALKVLAGVRIFSILGIVYGHRIAYSLMAPVFNYGFIEDEFRSVAIALTSRADLFVDTFFFLGGLLLAYNVLLLADRKILINPAVAILLRYMRLTPSYALVILFYATLFRMTARGPIWNVIMASEVEDCRQYWWSNLLYLSNYVHVRNMCLSHTWYLSADFHYFIIGTLICLILRRNKKYGLIAICFATVVSILIPFVITCVFHGPAIFKLVPNTFSQGKTNEEMLLTYNRSHTRATPYFIGMFVGYFYHKLRGSKNFIHLIPSCLILIISTAMMIVPLLVSSIFYNPYREYNVIEAAAFISLHRSVFILGTIGVIFVASFGTNRLLFKILTWNPLIPLSKLVYGVYLTHVILQVRFNASQLNPQYFAAFDKFIKMLSDGTFAFAIAFLLYMFVEAPIKNFMTRLVAPAKKKPVELKVSLENGNNNNNTNSNDSTNNNVSNSQL